MTVYRAGRFPERRVRPVRRVYLVAVRTNASTDVDTESSSISSAVLFREVQHFRKSWLWLVVLLPTILAWWAFVRQVLGGEPVGNNPAPDWGVWLIWVFIGLGLPLFFGLLRMVVEVTGEEIIIHYRPLTRRRIAIRDIVRAEVRRYNAIKEYGGWGVKGWSRDKMVYNVSGNQGVELLLRDGRSVMIGSSRPTELLQALSR